MDPVEKEIDEEFVDEQDEQDEQETEEQETNPVEERALKMGWVPKDVFRGDPANWRPAEEFVERGEMLIPILNKKIRNLEKQQNDKDKAFNTYLDDLRTKLHAQKVADHEAAKRQAVDEGDTDAYNRLSNEAPKNDLPEYKPPAPPSDPVFDDWVADNPWYQTDFERNQEAENYGRFLKNSKPELEGREFLDEISKHIRKKYSNPNRDKPSAVDGETQKAKLSSGKLYNKLEAEAKATFNSFVKQGIFKNTAEDREAYAKDVLE
jgi:hypothetical protein